MGDLEPRGRLFRHEHEGEKIMSNSEAAYTCSNYMSELQAMEQNFINNQLAHRVFKPLESPNQRNDISNPSMLPNQMNIINLVNDQLIPGGSNLNIELQDHPNMYPYESMLQDNVLFDPMVLEIINFEIPTSPSQLIDTTACVNKATTEYGEEFSKKVEENLRILLEAMKGSSSGCCGEGGKKGVCCNGKCWGYVESRWREMQKASKGRVRGRRRKETKLSPEQVEVMRHHQKIRNRIAAARTYYKEKAHVSKLEVQVQQLRAENKIRRNLVKFLERSVQIPSEKRSLGRTMSGPL